MCKVVANDEGELSLKEKSTTSELSFEANDRDFNGLLIKDDIEYEEFENYKMW